MIKDNSKAFNGKEEEVRIPYYPALPFVEVVLNYVIWIGGVLGSIFMLFYSSRNNAEKYKNADYVENGWKDWIGRYKDVSDYEWSFWVEFLWPVVVIGFTGHFVVARLGDFLYPKHRFKVYFLYGTIFTTLFLGIRGILFMLGHFVIQYVTAVLTKSVIACWITGCMLAYSLVNETCSMYVQKLYIDEESKAFFLIFATAMCNLRYIAFSVEYVWSCQKLSNARKDEKEKIPIMVEKSELSIMEGNILRKRNLVKNEKTITDQKSSPPIGPSEKILPLSFLDLLVYQMYYPLLYGGPIINYNEFAMQINKPPVIWNSRTVKRFVVGMARHIFWHLFIEFVLHFFYVSAVFSDYYLLQKLPLLDLFGVGMAQVIFFYLKYVVMYGMPAHFSTSDNLDVPKGPHCVFSKHRMTDMWKYFDKGLHLWLLRYIYIPCGGSRVNLLRATINSILPFAFVSFWHGASRVNIYWGALSWFGVYIEGIALRVYKIEYVQKFESNYLTPAWSRRIRAGLSSIFMFLMLPSNLYFLSGIYIGDLCWQRFYHESFLAIFLMHLVFYGGCQSSMEFERMGL
ncbi:protein-cysteine N-palmitoyltransferase HHAT-like [Styela clava]